jgi:predicted alpha/beta-hydrolase family hydrolase
MSAALSERWQVSVGAETTSATYDPPAEPADALLVLAHGAGGHMEHRTTASIAAELRARGLHVVRFNFLYRELQQGPPDRMPRLAECFAAVVRHAREALRTERVFIGGHSMGGRAASMMAADGFECDGLVLLGYPLHPAGQPDKLRSAHLPRIRQPVICFNGTRDDLCRRDLMEAVVEGLPPAWTMHWLEAADHSLRVLKRSGRTDAEVLNEIGEATEEWMQGLERGGDSNA